jgi:eukaryotic-like serine/threonine-protein kinase
MNLRSASSQELTQRWKAEADDEAAEILFERYAVRLASEIAANLSQRFQSLVDPQDVVQSAWGSFFRGIRNSKLRASQIDSVWGLLRTIAKRKLLHSISLESAKKRGGDRNRIELMDLIGKPTSNAHPTLVDELMEELTQDQENADQSLAVAHLLLEGWSQIEIATKLGLSDRTIRRILQRWRVVITEQNNRRDDSSLRIETLRSLKKYGYSEFVLTQFVGAGAFGKVYRAVPQSLSKAATTKQDDIAVKFLRKEFWQNHLRRKRFLEELDIASRIQHQNIVRYDGWGETRNGGLFLVQEWVSGTALTQTPLQQVDLPCVIAQLCDALEVLHENQLTHGDLTPNNILIDESNVIRVTDFGLASSSQGLKRGNEEPSWEGFQGGTPGFAAPEQYSPAFGSVCAATDIFAMGGIAYWILFGQPPFHADSFSEMAARTISGTFELPTHCSAIVPTCSGTVEDNCSTKMTIDPIWQRFIKACLATAIADRPHSIAQVRSLFMANSIR